MFSINTKSTGLGSGCLMLFALPFAAVGVGALGWMGWTLLDWREAGGWLPVSAEIVTVAIEEHEDDEGGSTYETTATYRYDYAGISYTGTRVAIDTGADNIGGFQHRLYYDLKTAHERGTPVTAYVDPDDPNRAVLNRALRPGLFALKGIFALAFGGVGFGLLFGARYAAKKMIAEEKLRRRFPDEPWRWRPEWADGRIAGSARAAAYVAIAFAVLWNLISLPAALIVPGEIANGNTAAAAALLFPLIGLGLAAWAIRAWLQLKRFKAATFVLQRMPVALGGRLKGTIRVEAEVPVTADFRLELECFETVTRGSGKNRRTEEKLLWQKQWRVPRHHCQIGSFTTIPVDVAMPVGQPATSMNDGDGKTTWRLEVAGECPGPDFWSKFELPVFETAETPEPTETPAAPRFRRAAQQSDACIAGHRLRAHAARRRSVDLSPRPAQKRCARDQRVRRGLVRDFRRAVHHRCPARDPDRVLVVRRSLSLVGTVALVHRAPRDARPRRPDARTPRLHGARARRDSRAMDPQRQRQTRDAGRQQALLRPEGRNQRRHAHGRELTGRLRRRELARAALAGGARG